MRKVLNVKLKYSILCVLLLVFSFCTNKSAHQEGHIATKYTCSMHPQIVADKPGTCPICHMDLVPVKKHTSHDTANVRLNALVKPSNQLVLSEIRTVKPSSGVRTSDIQVQGIINYDTNNWNSVSSRVSGRIERLYVKYNYQYVNKGQKLMDVYSPDLANSQQELLYLKASGDKNLLEAAKTKLRVLGASEQQINTVLRTGKIDYTFSIYSSYAGYVTEQSASGVSKSTSAQTGGTVISSEGGASTMNEMGNQAGSNPIQLPPVETSSPLQIREGQYISQGQKIFSLINTTSVWAEFFAGTEQLNYLRKGTSVQVTALDNGAQKSFTKISLIQPYYNEGATSSLLRARINNTNKQWKVGQLVTVKTDVDSKFGTWLPRSSVLRLGSRYVVFIRNIKTFYPIYISVNELIGEWVDVGNSLKKDTEVAVNAWFMVDGESFIKVDSLKRLDGSIHPVTK